MPDSMDPGLTGRCDFCQFSNLKVAPLTCMRHFYCFTCRKFVSRLQANDFSCKLCERQQRLVQAERRRHSRILDMFIEETAMERRSRLFKDVPITMSGSQVINLHNDKDDVDQDLSGNNDELDQLISSLSYEPSCAEKARAAPPSRAEKSVNRNKSGENFLTKGVAKCNLEGRGVSRVEKPTPPSAEGKYSEESRIYDWCVAAEKSLSTAAKSSDRFEGNSIRNACPSSSSENSLSKKKFQQQSKKKDKSYWWDDQSDSDDAEWEECFSKPGPLFQLTNEKNQSFRKPVVKRTCTPETGHLDRQAAIVSNNNLNPKDRILNFDWSPKHPPDEPVHKTSPAVDISSQRQFSVMGDQKWINMEPSISPVDLTDHFWDQ